MVTLTPGALNPKKHIPNPLRMRKAVYERDLNDYQYCSYQYYVGLLKMLLLSTNPTNQGPFSTQRRNPGCRSREGGVFIDERQRCTGPRNPEPQTPKPLNSKPSMLFFAASGSGALGFLGC